MTARADQVTFHLEIPIGPKWRNIELLRAAVRNCLAAIFDDAELSGTVGTITSELMENAVKYGDWTATVHPHLTLRVCGTMDRVDVEVTSPIKPDSEHLAALRRTIERIEASPSRREAYLARMREVAEQPLGSGISKMGLVRIAYEGPCRLEAKLDDENMLHVTATMIREASD
jgi:hypothetical protein